MENRDDNSSSESSEHRDAQEILEAMRPTEPYTTDELAEKLDWPPRTVHYHLDKLADQGDIRKKKPGKRTVIWMRPADSTN